VPALRSAAAALAAALAALAVAACGEPGGPEGTGIGSLPLDGRSPLEPPSKRIRVLVELQRPSLADQMQDEPYAEGRQSAYVSSLHDEVEALQSSLRAKGVTLGDPVLYGRVWNGFAATIAARDLPQLQALGLRAEPVRRFYGAASTAGAQAVQDEAPEGSESVEPGADPEIALLDTGVDVRAPGLAGRVLSGRDAVGHDGDPAPGGSAERHGTAIAGVLASAPESGRILAVRVAGLRRDPETGARVEYGTTDELLEGLERAVDPDGDGDVTDRVPVALVGVNSPYAGFDDSPESQAAAGATALGTLVVTPAGNEGRRVGRVGTIGSPGAAPDALTVAALEGGGAPALPTVRLGLATGEGRMLTDALLLGGAADALRAPITGLAGPSQANPQETGRALGGGPLEYFDVDAAPRARGRLVVVPARVGSAGAPLAERTSAAAEAGAAALVVCEPDAERPLPALPDGAAGIPVVGLRGERARRALDLTPGDGGVGFVSDPRQATDDGRLAPARASSQGPTYALAPKPDLAAPGTARVNGQFVSGTSVAAARVAVAAAQVIRARRSAEPAEIAARLTGTAVPRGPVLAAGAGEPRPAEADAASVVIEPGLVALPRQDEGEAFTARAELTVRNAGEDAVTLTPEADLPGTRVSLDPEEVEVPAGKARAITVSATAAGSGRPPGFLTGRLRAGPAGAILTLPVGPPPPAPLSPLTLVTRGERTTGVRFTAGAVRTVDEAREVQPLGGLRLEVLDADGAVVRELTPQGGARDLLPGEYAYTLTKEAMGALEAGPFRFRATARGPAGGPEAVRTSPEFGEK
jgi:hypothetical protein